MNGNPLPLFRRARGYRLYDHSGQRYLDLYQGNGSGLLGHRAFRITTELKDVISRGLISDLPSVYLRRMEKAGLVRRESSGWIWAGENERLNTRRAGGPNDGRRLPRPGNASRERLQAICDWAKRRNLLSTKHLPIFRLAKR